MEHGLLGTGNKESAGAWIPCDESLLEDLSTLGWEHINLIGEYVRSCRTRIGDGKFRPLRQLKLS
ncbi:protein of unknown function [Xenorhabdus poinarii G6]|uniref:Uncharacterized protein n=1 Tax=Xenorhabdus poinarii G6 TaxID=1354304 RepID=A0A068R653_9GAMM|nr:protein of unknown function [Xenorhabdus poinarii G6]